jgi:hypothetical protein
MFAINKQTNKKMLCKVKFNLIFLSRQIHINNMKSIN